MTGKRLGYIRVSSVDQNIERQLDGISVDKTFIDRCSGKDVARPELQRMLEFCREDDLVLAHSIDRLARNMGDLLSLVEGLTKRGVHIQFMKENLLFTGDDSPVNKLMLSLLGAVAAFERDLCRSRQQEGIALAKAKGVYKGKRHALGRDEVQSLRDRVAAGEKKAALAKELGICRETLYSYLRIDMEIDFKPQRGPVKVRKKKAMNL